MKHNKATFKMKEENKNENLRVNQKYISLISMIGTVVIWLGLNFAGNTTGTVINNIWIASVFLIIAHMVADAIAGIISAKMFLNNVDNFIKTKDD